MGAKTRLSAQGLNSIEDLELTLSELNQSVAYLSKMVLQLQRSINANQRNRQSAGQEPQESKPETLH